MSQENVDLVRRLYDAFNRKDVPAVMELLHPEIEFHEPEGLSWGGVYRGHEELQRLFGLMLENFGPEMELVEPEFYDAGEDKVVVRARATARGVDFPYLELVTIRDGKIAAFDVYADTVVINDQLEKVKAGA